MAAEKQFLGITTTLAYVDKDCKLKNMMGYQIDAISFADEVKASLLLDMIQ